ncbi:MAG TPA: protein kinase [Gemmataceae bacterium]|nr:protein kinase [Gemmataceae bacterium]
MSNPSVPSTVFGPHGYRLLERLGRGACGEVWRAEAPGGIKVAIKILSLALKPAEAQRELAALQSILELRHPYLLALQAIFAEDDRILVVMELADGSLCSRLESCQEQGQAGIPSGELLGYMREAAEAIDFLHANRRLHRDVKPDNILLVAQHVKVADYGLARVLVNQQTVQTQSVVGTPSYMAPETWEGSVGPRSDQYSLAASYVHLRTGHLAFAAQNLPQLAYLHANVAPDLDGLSGAERQILEQALAKKSADRYPTCQAFVAALKGTFKPQVPPSPTKKLPSNTPTVYLPASPERTATAEKGGRRDSGRTVDPPAASKRAVRGSRGLALGCLGLLVVGAVIGAGGWLYHGGNSTGSGNGGDSVGGSRSLGGGEVAEVEIAQEIAEVEIAQSVKMKFCWIPAGEAQLGAPKGESEASADEAEELRGKFKTKGFWLAKFPVTQEQWQALMNDNPTPSYFKPTQDRVKEAGISDTRRFPVEQVSWMDCQDFLVVQRAVSQGTAQWVSTQLRGKHGVI